LNKEKNMKAGALEFRHHTLLTTYEVSPIKVVAATATDGLAIPITHPMVTKTNAGAETNTVANGVPGQMLNIYLTAKGGASSITPATLTGFATVELDTVGDQVTMMYVDDTVGWIIIGCTGVTAQPVLTV
jgi:hypothetical protein